VNGEGNYTNVTVNENFLLFVLLKFLKYFFSHIYFEGVNCSAKVRFLDFFFFFVLSLTFKDYKTRIFS
jgi:hypothetical protein